MPMELDKVLRCYPKMDDAELLSFGFKYGFKLHYEGSRRLIETKNLKSVAAFISIFAIRAFLSNFLKIDIALSNDEY
jgi:hypothetical protein